MVDKRRDVARLFSLSPGEFMTIKEHDCVVLTADLPKEVGTVVHIHGNGVAYEVEFRRQNHRGRNCGSFRRPPG